MFFKIKNRLEKELAGYLNDLDSNYSLNKVSPFLSKSIKEFIRAKGKRLRPLLFLIGYLGFAKKTAPGLYRSALALELLHDFMLVHDDVIDKSEIRRGKLSLYASFNKYLYPCKNLKFNGQDLAIAAGDVIYALAMEAFLSVKETPKNKEKALRMFIQAALYTASGEFLELLMSAKDITKASKEDIYKIYDLKTARYTFAAPLSMGAELAGAGKKNVKMISNYGIYLGRAFQIKDDILGIFAEEKETGKSSLTDLQEAKKTILIWRAYQQGSKKDKSFIRKILAKRTVLRGDLLRMRKIILDTKTLEFAKGQICRYINKAIALSESLSMHKAYKYPLQRFCRELLTKEI
jgi:geranylgeranyl diphosphate synthase type I